MSQDEESILQKFNVDNKSFQFFVDHLISNSITKNLLVESQNNNIDFSCSKVNIPSLDVSLLNVTTLINNQNSNNAIIDQAEITSTTTDGAPGNLAFDINNLYICVNTNTWKKIPLQTI